MITPQKRRQQQEEAAKLKERVETALAKAIGWATAAGSYGSQLSNQTQVLQTIPDTVPETPNSAPEANQNLALEPNTLALQARTLLGNQNSFPQTSNTWGLVTLTLDEQQPLTNAAAAAAATSAAAASDNNSDRNVEVPKNSNAGEGSQGCHEGRHAPKRSSNPPYGPRRPGLAANFLAEQKSTKNFQKRSKFSRQKFGKFRQISMSKNVIKMVLGRSRKKFSHKNKISNKIPKKRKEIASPLAYRECISLEKKKKLFKTCHKT
jgi:hypothetical protein